MKVKQLEIRKARIEIIPMIDAIFFLLVFFMFSSLSMIRMAGSNIALPAKGQGIGKAASQDNKVIVSVTGDGQLFIGKNRINEAALKSSLQSQLGNRAEAVIVINMDKRQKAQKLIEVLDSVNQISLPSGRHPAVLIATEPVNPARVP